MKNVVGNENYRVQNDKFDIVAVVNVKSAFKYNKNSTIAKGHIFLYEKYVL